MGNVSWNEQVFTVLDPDELREINGGELPKLPKGISWVDVFNVINNNWADIKQGFIDGWNFDK
jgi:hypothetical protein